MISKSVAILIIFGAGIAQAQQNELPPIGPFCKGDPACIAEYRRAEVGIAESKKDYTPNNWCKAYAQSGGISEGSTYYIKQFNACVDSEQNWYNYFTTAVRDGSVTKEQFAECKSRINKISNGFSYRRIGVCVLEYSTANGKNRLHQFRP
jgi:hypothetical protein